MHNCGIFSLKIDNNSIENPKRYCRSIHKYFVSVESKVKEPPLASNFDKLKEFCDKKIPANIFFQYHIYHKKK